MSLSVRLKHDFGGFALDARFEAPPGLTVLFGRSGSGKTSIVNAVAGILKPREGRVVLGGRVLFDSAGGVDVPVPRRRMGYVFQDGRLFPHMSVRSNLLYGRPRNAMVPFGRMVDLLGIGSILDRRPGGLSGGEKARVAIGRALLREPELVLADEPLAALDTARKEEILPYFERLRDEVSVPILYVTHSASEVARLATWVVALEEGRVAREGEAREVLSDPEVSPAGAREAGAVLEARVRKHHDDGLTELDAGGVPLFLPRVARPLGASLRVRVAASEVILSKDVPVGLSALNVLPGRVETVRTGAGPGAMVALETPAGRILARVTARSVAALGLRQGLKCHALVKALAVAPGDVGS